jgi:hypothetical protein
MENVNSVIDNLCVKLGTTVEVLIPELIKYKRTGAIADVFISGMIVLAIILLIAKKPAKFMVDEEDTAELCAIKTMCSITLGVTGIICAIWFLFSIHDLVVWTVSPEGASVEYILRLLQ